MPRWAAIASMILTLGCEPDFRARCGANNPLVEDPSDALAVRVVVGPAPTRAGAGFCVRAERRDGFAVEVLSDASGTAMLPVDPVDGPWDVTIAQPSFAAVSILGVDGPLPGAIYTEPTQPSPPRIGRELDVTIEGVSDEQMCRVAVYDGPVLLPHYGGGLRCLVKELFHPEGPPFLLTAVVPDVGIFSLPPIPRDDRDMSVVMTGPPEPLPPIVTTDVTVHFPWPVASANLDAFWSFGRECERSGRCFWAPVPSTPQVDSSVIGSTSLTSRLSTYAAPLGPEVAWHTLTVRSADGRSIENAIVTVREFGGPIDIMLAEAGTASIVGTATEGLRWTSRNDAFDHAVLSLLTPEATPAPTPQWAEAWRVWTYEGSTFDAAVPSLPAGMQFSELGGTGDFIGIFPILVFRAATSHPWSTREPAAFATLSQRPIIDP